MSDESIEDRFAGQIQGERVLYVLRPHWLMLFFGMLKILLVATLVYLAVAYGYDKAEHLLPEDGNYQNYLFAALGLGTLFFLWWHHTYCHRLRAYITDRRIVRVEPSFPLPFLEKRRTLLWSETRRAKAHASNIIFRLFKIGEVACVPFLHTEDDVFFPYAHYFEDIVSFIDKLMLLNKSSPQELVNVRPFVAKPKGKRYQE